MRGYIVGLRGWNDHALVFAPRPSSARALLAHNAADIGVAFTELRARRAPFADELAARASAPRRATDDECAAVGFDRFTGTQQTRQELQR